MTPLRTKEDLLAFLGLSPEVITTLMTLSLHGGANYSSDTDKEASSEEWEKSPPRLSFVFPAAFVT